MLSRVLLLAAATGLVLATPARSQAPALTGLDAWKAIVGNTLVGKTPSGEPQVEYFAPDGVARNRIAGQPGEGEWSLRGDRVCTDYSDDDDDEDDGDAGDGDGGEDEEASCFGLSAQGDVAVLTDEAGKAREFRIVPGNAERL